MIETVTKEGHLPQFGPLLEALRTAREECDRALAGLPPGPDLYALRAQLHDTRRELADSIQDLATAIRNATL